MAREVSIRNGYTTKAIIIGLIVFVLWTAYQTPGDMFRGNIWYRMESGDYAVFNYVEGNHGNILYLTFGSMAVIIIILSLVNMIGKKPLFDRMEVTAITLFLPIVTFIMSGCRLPMNMMSLLTVNVGVYLRGYNYETLFPLLHPLLGPKDIDVIEAMQPSGAPIDWGAWMPTLGLFIFYSVSILFTFIFIALIFRRVWVEVEHLTFPSATFHTEIVELTQRDKAGRVKFWRSKYFLIGLIITLVWMVPTHLQMWWLPGNPFPASDGGVTGQPLGFLWPNGPYVLPYWSLTMQVGNILPRVGLMVNFMPWAIGWGFLNTIPNILGLLMAALIFTFIVPLTLQAIGIYGPYTPARIPMGIYTAYTLNTDPLGFPLGHCIFIGMIFGILVYTLWRNRRQLAPIFTALFKAPPKEVDAESPVPYRVVWVGLIISFVIWLICAYAVGIPLLAYLIYAIIITVFVTGSAKVFAETGGLFGWLLNQNWTHTTTHIFLGGAVIYLFGLYGEPNLTNMMSILFMGMFGAFFNYSYLWPIRASTWSLHSFKVAEVNKVDKKKLFSFLALLTVVAVVFSLVWSVWTVYAAPVDKPPGGWIQSSYFWDARDPNYVYGYLQTPDRFIYYSNSLQTTMWTTKLPYTVTFLAIGFLLPIVMSFLRGRFSWLMVGPAGFALGVALGEIMWSSWLAALIIKYLVIKVGGTKLYNEKALPFFVGTLMAYFLVIFFGDLGTWLMLPHI